MKLLKVSMAARQRGSFYITMCMVALLGLFLVTALKIAPAYLDNNVVNNTMAGIRANNNIAEMSLGEIRTSLMRTLNTNRIESLGAGNVVITRVGGQEFIDINYETRIPLFYNIDAVVRFDNRYPKF